MESRLHICIFSSLFSPIVGGAEVQAEKQARHLQTLGHNVIVLTLRVERQWKRCELLNGLTVVRIGGIYTRRGRLRLGRLAHFAIDLSAFLTLWRLRSSYDLIHVFNLTTPAFAAALLGWLTHKPVLITIASTGPSKAQYLQCRRTAMLMPGSLEKTHFLRINQAQIVPGDLTYLPQVALGGSVFLKCLRASYAFYQVLSTRGISYLTDHQFRCTQIIHIPNGVDVQRFRPAARLSSQERERTYSVFCIARLEYAKGIDVLLHAWHYLLHTYEQEGDSSHAHLYLVGEGTLHPQLERLASALAISESVTFLGLRTDIECLLQQADCFVLPSRWEGMPNALLEAMACGIPCVATRVSGSEDILIDRVNGILVEPEQPGQIVEAIHALRTEKELALRLGQAARTTILEHYQLSTIVEQSIVVYRRLLAPSGIHAEVSPEIGNHGKGVPSSALAYRTVSTLPPEWEGDNA